MRNLKKVLGMVLCLAMMLSIMVVGAGAAFADQDQIDSKHQEAVDIAVALNIINGIEKDGQTVFKPTDNVTREQMAKMICVLDNGGKDPQGATGNTFTDVPADRWSNKYVEACAARGVVAGVGGGKFNPGGDVTATQAAKMLLVELGYKEDLAKYTGSSWATNVNIDATKNGYYEDLEDIDVTAPLSREHAAQMIWNALQAAEITYDYTLVTDPVTGQLISKETPQNKDAQGRPNASLLTDKYGAGVTNENVLTDVEAVTSGANKGTFNLYLNGAAAPSLTKVDKDYADLLGQQVKVVMKDTDDVLGVYATDQNTVVTSVQSALDNDGAKIKVDGTKYEFDATVNTITIDPVAGDVVYAAGAAVTAAGLVNNFSYNEITLIDNNGNNKIDVVLTKVFVPAKVTYASSDEIIAGGVTYETDDHNIASGLAKDDFVVITYNIVDDCNDIVKLDVTTATANSVKASTDEYSIDGTWYYYDGSGKSIAAGDEIEYAAVNGVIVPDTVDSTADNIENMVLALQTDTGGLSYGQIKVMHPDGSIENVSLSKDSHVKVGAIVPGTLYICDPDENGYDISALKTTADAYGDYTAYTAGSYTVATNTTAKTATVNSVSVADDAVIFVYDAANHDGKVITGKQVKTVTVGSAKGNITATSPDYLAGKVSGLDRIAYAVVNLAAASTDLDDLDINNGDENYAYVTAASYTTKVSGTDYTSFSIWTGAANEDVMVKGTANTYAVGNLIKYDAIESGVITGVSKITVANNNPTDITSKNEIAAVRGIEGDYIFLDGTTDDVKAELTKDTKYLYVDSNESTAANIGKADGSVVLADENASGVFTDNVIAIVNASDEVELLVVDVKNKMTAEGLNDAFTATNPTAYTTVSGTFSKTSGLKAGDSVDLKLENSASAAVSVKVTLTNGVFTSNDSNVIASVSVPANGSVTLTAFVSGNVTAVVAAP